MYQSIIHITSPNTNINSSIIDIQSGGEYIPYGMQQPIDDTERSRGKLMDTQPPRTVSSRALWAKLRPLATNNHSIEPIMDTQSRRGRSSAQRFNALMPTYHDIAALSGCVFREGDRREAELCLVVLIMLLTLTIMMMLIFMVVVILFDFVNNSKFWSRSSAGDDFLGVDLVEYTGKRSLFCLNTTTIRISLLSAF